MTAPAARTRRPLPRHRAATAVPTTSAVTTGDTAAPVKVTTAVTVATVVVVHVAVAAVAAAVVVVVVVAAALPPCSSYGRDSTPRGASRCASTARGTTGTPGHTTTTTTRSHGNRRLGVTATATGTLPVVALHTPVTVDVVFTVAEGCTITAGVVHAVVATAATAL